VSDNLLERIAVRLGNPRLDPHGDPIRTREGRLEPLSARGCPPCRPGTVGEFVRVDDVTPRHARHLTAEGIQLGARLEVSSAPRPAVPTWCAWRGARGMTRQLGPALSRDVGRRAT